MHHEPGKLTVHPFELPWDSVALNGSRLCCANGDRLQLWNLFGMDLVGSRKLRASRFLHLELRNQTCIAIRPHAMFRADFDSDQAPTKVLQMDRRAYRANSAGRFVALFGSADAPQHVIDLSDFLHPRSLNCLDDSWASPWPVDWMAASNNEIYFGSPMRSTFTGFYDHRIVRFRVNDNRVDLAPTFATERQYRLHQGVDQILFGHSGITDLHGGAIVDSTLYVAAGSRGIGVLRRPTHDGPCTSQDAGQIEIGDCIAIVHAGNRLFALCRSPKSLVVLSRTGNRFEIAERHDLSDEIVGIASS